MNAHECRLGSAGTSSYSYRLLSSAIQYNALLRDAHFGDFPCLMTLHSTTMADGTTRTDVMYMPAPLPHSALNVTFRFALDSRKKWNLEKILREVPGAPKAVSYLISQPYSAACRVTALALPPLCRCGRRAML